jgi:hypothetical protein
VIPDILKPFLNGKVKIHISITAEGSEVVCVDTEVSVDT